MNKKIPYIEKGKGGIDFYHHTRDSSPFFLYGYYFVIVVFFLVLILRLFQLTVVKGAYYRSLSEQNRIREAIIEPKRGTITDRKGFIIAENSEPDAHQDGMRISTLRYYHDAETFAHIVGYRSTADETDLHNDTCDNKLVSGDKIGKKGVEKIYDCQLRGRTGKKLIEVDAKGKRIRTLSVVQPEEGVKLRLAMDKDLQKKAYDLIKGHRAVAIAMNPRTGEVLALASAPSFDPQAFEQVDNSRLKQYFSDTSKPLFNRATEGTYPPGSTFKIVMSAAALEEQKVTESTEIEDTGVLKAGTHEFGNWYYLEHGKKEGMVNIVKALQRSNDIYFYQIGGKLGPVEIKSWAEKFGYGRKSTLGLDEAAGTIPSPFWKEEVLKEQWYTGDTYNMSIGQGYMLATPLQVALATNVIASNGELCTPRLLRTESETLPDSLLNRDSHPDCKTVPLSKATMEIIQKGMVAACTTGGTGWPLFNFNVADGHGGTIEIPTACKTGTAESHAESKKPHAWFTVYAPVIHPEISVTVMFEEEGQGSDVAAPVAKEILKAYFERIQ